MKTVQKCDIFFDYLNGEVNGSLFTNTKHPERNELCFVYKKWSREPGNKLNFYFPEMYIALIFIVF